MEANRTLLNATVFSVEERAFTRPDGRLVKHEVVVHGGAAVIIPLLGDDRMVLIRNHRLAVRTELLELPAGTLEVGEAPEACAGRELEEETGFQAAQIEPLCAFYSSPGICTERMYVFVASGLTPTQQNLDEGEEIEVCIHTIEQVRQMLVDGVFEDAKTIAGLGTFLMRQGATN